MPVLKYRDPNDGLWYPVSYGGGSSTPAPNEVVIGSTAPTDPDVELWLDEDEPATGGGGLDQATADDLYVNVTGDTMTGPLTVSGSRIILTGPDSILYWPDSDRYLAVDAGTADFYIGIGTSGDPAQMYIADPTVAEHAATKGYVDTNSVSITGDTMTGPLVVPAPTLITQVGRWADGLPRFPDAAARDAAYATFGGPVDGMKAWTADDRVTRTWDAGLNEWTALAPTPASFIDLPLAPTWATPTNFRLCFNGMVVNLNGVVYATSDYITSAKPIVLPGGIPPELMPPLSYEFFVGAINGGNTPAPAFIFYLEADGGIKVNQITGTGLSWDSSTWMLPNSTWVPISA